MKNVIGTIVPLINNDNHNYGHVLIDHNSIELSKEYTNILEKSYNCKLITNINELKQHKQNFNSHFSMDVWNQANTEQRVFADQHDYMEYVTSYNFETVIAQ